MSWAEEHRIETPEQIDLGLELAGPGSRMVAQVLDWLVKFFIIILLALGALAIAAATGRFGGDGTAAIFIASLVGAVAFVFIFGYDIYYEGCRNGQTPGKKHVQIRVVRADGGPIDLRAAAIRNLVGLVDFLPVGYFVGGLFMLLNRNAQRIGDIAAGTVVVRDREEPTPVEQPMNIEHLAISTVAFSREQLARLTPADRHVLESYFTRYPLMDLDSRAGLGRKLFDTFQRKTGYSQIPGAATIEPEQFLASLCRDLGVMHGRPG